MGRPGVPKKLVTRSLQVPQTPYRCCKNAFVKRNSQLFKSSSVVHYVFSQAHFSYISLSSRYTLTYIIKKYISSIIIAYFINFITWTGLMNDLVGIFLTFSYQTRLKLNLINYTSPKN